MTSDGKVDSRTKEAVLDSIRRFFRPEFLNRISSIVIFNRLAQSDIQRVVDLRLEEVQKRLMANSKNIILDVDLEARAFLGQAGFSVAYGARPLNRVIQNQILNKMAVMLLKGQIIDGETAKVTLSGGRINIMPNHSVDADDDETMLDDFDLD